MGRERVNEDSSTQVDKTQSHFQTSPVRACVYGIPLGTINIHIDIGPSKFNPKQKERIKRGIKPVPFQMAERLSLSLTLSPSTPAPTTMAAFSTTASSRILPSATAAAAAASRARLSFSSSLKCFRSSPLVSHLFLNQVLSLSFSPLWLLCLFLCLTDCLW